MPDQDAFVPLLKERMVNPALKLFVTPGRFDLGTKLREFQLAYDPLLWLPGQGRPDDTGERWLKRRSGPTCGWNCSWTWKASCGRLAGSGACWGYPTLPGTT